MVTTCGPVMCAQCVLQPKLLDCRFESGSEHIFLRFSLFSRNGKERAKFLLFFHGRMTKNLEGSVHSKRPGFDQC
jgi:hypothetical protein